MREMRGVPNELARTVLVQNARVHDRSQNVICKIGTSQGSPEAVGCVASQHPDVWHQHWDVLIIMFVRPRSSATSHLACYEFIGCSIRHQHLQDALQMLVEVLVELRRRSLAISRRRKELSASFTKNLFCGMDDVDAAITKVPRHAQEPAASCQGRGCSSPTDDQTLPSCTLARLIVVAFRKKALSASAKASERHQAMRVVLSLDCLK